MSLHELLRFAMCQNDPVSCGAKKGVNWSTGKDGVRLGLVIFSWRCRRGFSRFLSVLICNAFIVGFFDAGNRILEVLDRLPHGIPEFGQAAGANNQQNHSNDQQMLKRDSKHASYLSFEKSRVNLSQGWLSV